jgi:hypothetical protein
MVNTRNYQNGYGAHPATYPMGTRGTFPEGKATGTWSFHLVLRSKKRVELYHHSPNMSSQRGVQLKHRDNFDF